MKRFFLFGAVIMLSIYTVVLPKAELAKEEKELMRQTQVLRAERGNYRRNLVKGAQYGAAAGATLGAVGVISGNRDPDSTLLGLAGKYGLKSKFAGKVGGVFGRGIRDSGYGVFLGIWALPYTAGMQWWQRRKVNRIVNKHTSLHFKTIPITQALIFVAAYKRNIPLLQKLITEQPDFIVRSGVWKALAELFFNDNPVSSRVKELQKMIQN